MANGKHSKTENRGLNLFLKTIFYTTAAIVTLIIGYFSAGYFSGTL